MDTNLLLENMMNEYFNEASNNEIPDLIENAVKILERKGYRVKYASPGHLNTNFKQDKNNDHVVYGKFASTGRIIFERDYKFKNTPQGWEWKVLHNNAKALYVKPYTYNEKMGSKEEAFKKWQTFYIDSIKSWANSLPPVGIEKDTPPDDNFNK